MKSAAAVLLSHHPRRYRIVPKRDFGNQPYLVHGRCVMSGYVVTANTGLWKGCNIMPGATWSEDIPGALQMIRVLEHVGGLKPDGGCVDSDRFWKLLHRINGATRRSREYSKMILQSFGTKQGATNENA